MESKAKKKVLNLYAGIGGNRKFWKNVEVTAIEINPEIAKIYQEFFPEDKVIVTDAHQYLLEHFKEFDFIWSSPPCPSHSRIRFMGTKAPHPTCNTIIPIIYPDMNLYQEVILLSNYFKGKFVVENVKGYYDPLIKPQEVGRHYFWSNFIINNINVKSGMHSGTISELEKRKGFNIKKYKLRHRKDVILRNCVEPELGLHIFECAYKKVQQILKEDKEDEPTKSKTKD